MTSHLRTKTKVTTAYNVMPVTATPSPTSATTRHAPLLQLFAFVMFWPGILFIQKSAWLLFSASFRSLHVSNIIFSRRSPVTNIFQNYIAQSPTPIPYPISALFFSIALTYCLTYLLVYCLSLCHLPHLQVPGGKGLSLVHYCILSF